MNRRLHEVSSGLLPRLRLEIQAGEVHIALRQRAQSQPLPALPQSVGDETLCQRPVMPLPPGHRVRRILGGSDRDRSPVPLTIYIERDISTGARGIEQVGGVHAAPLAPPC